MKIVNCKLEIIFLILFFIPGISSAATLSISGPERDAIVGENFSVDVVLVTVGEQINAVEGDILYDRDLVSVEKIREDGSVISLWLTRPQRAEEGMVRFSGVIPGGSPSARTHIMTLVFKPLKTGSARVWLRDNSRAFLNDGAGTLAPLSFIAYETDIRLSYVDETERNKALDQTLFLNDTTPPELFQPERATEANVFDGRWFLAFSTTDKQSGIDHYEVYEGQKRQIADITEWKRVESPYLIADQELQSFIYIKAIDRHGNERVVIVEPQTQTNWLLWIVLSVIGGVFVVLWKEKKILNS